MLVSSCVAGANAQYTRQVKLGYDLGDRLNLGYEWDASKESPNKKWDLAIVYKPMMKSIEPEIALFASDTIIGRSSQKIGIYGGFKLYSKKHQRAEEFKGFTGSAGLQVFYKEESTDYIEDKNDYYRNDLLVAPAWGIGYSMKLGERIRLETYFQFYAYLDFDGISTPSRFVSDLTGDYGFKLGYLF